MEVPDDKSLCRAVPKQAQIEPSMHLPKEVRMAKLPDKIRNLCDLIAYPLDWSLARRQQYSYWARKVIDGLRGVCNDLETEFDRRYQMWPTK